MNALAKIVATFSGVGFFPLAPGTAASALAAAAYLAGLHRLPWPLYLLLVAVLFISGGRAASAYSRALGQKDPGRIVIDEVCGQLLALFLVPPSWTAVLLAFAFFRVFDIIKPPPIRRLETLPAGWGIMADDAGAGLIAAALVHLILRVV